MATNIQRTTTASGNRRIFTYSAWLKMSLITSGEQFLIASNNEDAGGSAYSRVHFKDNKLTFSNYDASLINEVKTNRVFRDTSAWYHIVVAIDTTQGTASDRVKMYVNGVQETSMATTSYPAQNYDTFFNNNSGSNYKVHIGTQTSNMANYFSGSMSHIHFSDGYALAPTVFGSTDSTTGEWKINTSPSFTLGNNGFTILKDGNTITDQSSNSNNFTLYSGTLTKTEDCPSNVFATLNPLMPFPSGLSFSNGNLTLSESGSQWKGSVSTIAPTKGKWYWEAKYNTGTGIKLDITRIQNNMSFMATSNQSYGAYSSDGYGYQLNNSGTDYYCSNNSCTTWNSSRGNSTKIYMVAVDLDNGKYWIGADGTWFNTSGTANPATGSDPRHSFSAKINGDPWYFTMSIEGSSSSHNANFGNGKFGTTAVSSAGTNASGNGIFEYDTPTGYTALSTKGLNL